MTLNEYQELAARTAIYTGRGTFVGLMYVTGKMNGEAGELAENVFKALRDDGIAVQGGIDLVKTNGMQCVAFDFGVLLEERRHKLKKELGDVLWYVSQAAYELGYTLNEIAETNVAKLTDRHDRGLLHGSGDNR